MKKISILVLFFIIGFVWRGFSQLASDGSYFWNSLGVTYSINDKTELVFGNKDHYNNQINHFDYLHFELIAYRKLTSDFSLGLGIRQTESYKLNQWNPGQTYMFYGVYTLNPWGLKIKFANRLAAKTYKTAETQYGLDNNSNIDFFVRSTCKFPKPYIMDEIFSNLELGKIQTIRLYGGFHFIKKNHWGIDLYYCYMKTRSTDEWKKYDVLGLSTKFRI